MHNSIPPLSTVRDTGAGTFTHDRRTYVRSWHWPFEGRRLAKVRGLQLAAAFLAIGIALRLVVSLTLGLTDDEAWYWAISNRLDWSYVVHPPLSVWMVRLSTLLFGHNTFAVRLPSIVCSVLGAVYLLRLLVRMGWAKGTYTTAVLCLVLPLLFLGGILTGPDLPLFMAWAGLMDISFALGMGYEKRKSAWFRLGLFAGLALLSKYTGVLAIGASGLWLLSTRAGRRSFLTPWPYIALLVALSLFSPVIVWNSQHDWSSFRFQFLDRHGSGNLNLRRWGIFWLSQIFLYGPAVVLGWLLLMRDAVLGRFSAKPATNSGPLALPVPAARPVELRFLALWAFIPGFVFFVQPLFSAFKIHWALFAFIPVLVYFGALSANKLSKPLIRAAVLTGAILTSVGMFCFYVPVVAAITLGFGKQYVPNHDITNDVYGWREFGAFASAYDISENLPLVTTRYQTASQAAFGLASASSSTITDNPTKNILLIPHDAYDLRDWAGPSTLPAEFIYVSDNRYDDPAEQAYPSHECKPLPSLVRLRGSYPAKEIYLKRCELKAIN